MREGGAERPSALWSAEHGSYQKQSLPVCPYPISPKVGKVGYCPGISMFLCPRWGPEVCALSWKESLWRLAQSDWC